MMLLIRKEFLAGGGTDSSATQPLEKNTPVQSVSSTHTTQAPAPSSEPPSVPSSTESRPLDEHSVEVQKEFKARVQSLTHSGTSKPTTTDSPSSSPQLNGQPDAGVSEAAVEATTVDAQQHPAGDESKTEAVAESSRDAPVSEETSSADIPDSAPSSTPVAETPVSIEQPSEEPASLDSSSAADNKTQNAKETESKSSTPVVSSPTPIDEVECRKESSKEESPAVEVAEDLSAKERTTEISTDDTPKHTAQSFEPDKVASTPEPTDADLMPPPSTASPPADSPVEQSNTPPSAQTPAQTSGLSVPAMKTSKSMSDAPAVSKPYNYKEDPSQPLNLEAKCVYDREFLISLQFVAPSKQKPEGLPILNDILLPQPLSADNRLLMSSSGSRQDFFAKTPRSSTSKNTGKKDSMSQRRQPPTIQIEYKRADVKLTRVDNAWKPGEKLKTEELTTEEKVHEELLRRFRGILNKITPQKFQSLVEQVMALPVKTEKDLDGVMNLVFEKAITEPGFSVTYASLCQKIAKHFKVQSDQNPNEEVNFRKLLLCRCQREFEASDKDDKEMVKKKEAVEKASEEDKRQLQEEFELFVTKARKRKLGNIRFIGELFKLNMLVEKIMHDCIITLLKAADEENLECLCRLLSTIGKELDSEKAKARTDQYFSEMKKIATGQSSKKVSSRIRFALQDVIELRENNWKPRRENNNPKTIKEIHAEAALEAHEKQMLINRSSQNRLPAQQPRNDRGNRANDADGWSHVGGGGGKSQRIDPSKLKLTKQYGEGEVQLGPGRGFGPGGGWSRGSSGSGKNTPPQQQEDRPSTPTNKFAALQQNDRMDEPRSRSGQRLPTTGRGSIGRGVNRRGFNTTPRGSMEKERSSAVAAVRQISKSGSSRGPSASRDSSLEGRNNRPSTPTQAPQSTNRYTSSSSPPTTSASKQLTKNEWDNKMKSILDELFHNKDMKEAVACVKDLGVQRELENLTTSSINYVLERSSLARKSTGHFFAELIKSKLLPFDTHLKGVGEILEIADEMSIDIPNLWSYLGELFAPAFVETDLSLTRLIDLCKPLKEIEKAATLAAAVLEEASHQIGHVKVGQKWNSCSMKWSNFLSPGQNEEEFITSNKLQYTVESNSTQTTTVSEAELKEGLKKLLFGSEPSDEAIFDYIDSHLTSEQSSQASFIRIFTTSVFKSCIDSQKKLNEDKLKRRAQTLIKYLDNKPEREATALLCLEGLMDELQHPAELLGEFCYCLSEDEVISDESFQKWEKTSKNGIAMKSISNFFTWLREDN